MPHEGDTLAGRYRLASRLGSGGMSEVWLAEDGELSRRVAIKFLAPTADRMRFEREARAHAGCSHSNVACVYDYGETENRPYIVLEYLPGGTLEDRLTTEAPLSDSDTAQIAGDIAAGMAYAHSQGLVHRDLKPANVLFDDDGRAKISDFGIAHTLDASTLTEAGTILGTAAYASPEQATGQPVTSASDVYSFGVILFRMLTGRLPFAGTSPMELLVQHARAQAPPVREFRDDAPPHLEALTMSALAKDPDARPPDGNALVAALAAKPEPSDDTAATQALVPARRRWSRRSTIGGAAALGILVSVGFAAAVLATSSNSGEPSPAPAATGTRNERSSGVQPDSATSSTATTRTGTTRTAPTTTAPQSTRESSTRSTPTTPADGTPTSTTVETTTTTSTTSTTTDPTDTTGATTSTP